LHFPVASRQRVVLRPERLREDARPETDLDQPRVQRAGG